MYLWLSWVFLAARRLSLVEVSGGLPFLVVRGLLIAVASCGAQALGMQVSVVAAHRLSSCGTRA